MGITTSDNVARAIGYGCIALVAITLAIGISWVLSPQEFTFTLEIETDNNTKESIEAMERLGEPKTICYSENCYWDLNDNLVSGCTMNEIDCELFKDKYGWESP